MKTEWVGFNIEKIVEEFSPWVFFFFFLNLERYRNINNNLDFFLYSKSVRAN